MLSWHPISINDLNLKSHASRDRGGKKSLQSATHTTHTSHTTIEEEPGLKRAANNAATSQARPSFHPSSYYALRCIALGSTRLATTLCCTLTCIIAPHSLPFFCTHAPLEEPTTIQWPNCCLRGLNLDPPTNEIEPTTNAPSFMRRPPPSSPQPPARPGSLPR